MVSVTWKKRVGFQGKSWNSWICNLKKKKKKLCGEGMGHYLRGGRHSVESPGRVLDGWPNPDLTREEEC